MPWPTAGAATDRRPDEAYAEFTGRLCLPLREHTRSRRGTGLPARRTPWPGSAWVRDRPARHDRPARAVPAAGSVSTVSVTLVTEALHSTAMRANVAPVCRGTGSAGPRAQRRGAGPSDRWSPTSCWLLPDPPRPRPRPRTLLPTRHRVADVPGAGHPCRLASPDGAKRGQETIACCRAPRETGPAGAQDGRAARPAASASRSGPAATPRRSAPEPDRPATTTRTSATVRPPPRDQPPRLAERPEQPAATRNRAIPSRRCSAVK